MRAERDKRRESERERERYMKGERDREREIWKLYGIPLDTPS